ncbi:MAG: hypothetical protein JSV80_04485 [Acidobacteriota bacterium]|nr:MAG: hypothetical protein JSV80_04485 [Acidobacteriota bacterium]
MTFARLLIHGFRRAVRQPRLIFLAYAVCLLPALIVVTLVGGNLAPALDHSLFARAILEGRWFSVWTDVMGSQATALVPLLERGTLIGLILAAVLQILLAAGIVEVLVRREDSGATPFVSGVVRNAWTFVRSAFWFVIAAALVGGIVAVCFVAFRRLASARGNGWYDVVGLLVGATVGLLLFALIDLAYDLSRIAAVRHRDKKTLRGFLRGLGFVVKRPALFAPLYLSFVIMPLALHALYYAVRSRWTVASALGVVVLLIAQQAVMLARATLKITFWGAEVACFETLGAPRLCRPKTTVRRSPEPRVALAPEQAGGEIASTT